MKLDKRLPEKHWVAYSIATCSAVLLYVLLGNLPSIVGGISQFFHYISPILLGIVIAYVLDPVANLMQVYFFAKVPNARQRWILSSVAAIVLVTVFITILTVSLVPQVVSSITSLVANAGIYASSARRALNELGAFAAEHNVDISNITQAANDLVGTITRLIPSNVGNIINTSLNFGKSAFNALISFILAIYFLLDKDRIGRTVSRLFHALLNEQQFSESMSFWRRSNSILMRYVAFDLLDGLIIGITNYIFMKFFGMQYAMLISVVVGATNLAPTFGPILGAIIGSFILVLINPWHALWFLIFTLILQTIDGYVLKPRLFSGSLGVPSVWILIALVTGGRMFGVTGILLAIPFAAIISFVVSDFITRREEARSHPAAETADASTPIFEEEEREDERQ